MVNGLGCRWQKYIKKRFKQNVLKMCLTFEERNVNTFFFSFKLTMIHRFHVKISIMKKIIKLKKTGMHIDYKKSIK